MTLPIEVNGPRVIGLDLSLTASGVAIVANHQIWTTTLKPKVAGHRRLEVISDKIAEWAADADLILVEGAAYGREQQAFNMGGLWWVVTHRLWHEAQDCVVVPPACVKKYATGTGRASKEIVGYECVRRFPGEMITDNNQSDALWLAHMGLDWLGWPLIGMPALNRKALDAIETWPARDTITRFPTPSPSRILAEA
jgi:Holliday junction resolvasome RuvABC endonuclease subunit